MASTAVETKSCQCVCEKNEGGDCVCVCTVPCAFDAENKTVEWACNCGCKSQCRFQIKCNRKAEDSCCGGGDTCERNVFVCKSKSAGKECTVKINKCKCCEVTRVDCGGSSCCSSSAGCSEAKKACCKESGGCC